jgi:hypothetical protein
VTGEARRLAPRPLRRLPTPATTSKITIARLGTYKDPRWGTFSISEKDFEGWSTNLASTFGGAVSVDFDHSSDRGRGTEAAGWIVGLERQGKDVVADVEWTPRGAAAIRDRSYRHISPTFTSHYVDEFGKDRGRALLGAACSNRPVLRSLPTLSLSRESYDGVAVPKKKGKSMSKKKKAKQLARKAERKAVKQLARKARKTIRTLAANTPSTNPAATFWPSSTTSATGAGRVPPGLDDAGLLLHATIAGKAARDGKHYFQAMSDLTGNQSYAQLSDIPPAAIQDTPGLMTGIDPDQAALYMQARALAIASGIGWNDALEILMQQRELRELQADDGSAPVDWLDSTERPSPPRPFGQGGQDDWARDQRRAAAAGVEITKDAWQAGAELGVDAVGQLADAQRADRVAALKERSGGALEAARRREDDRRTAAISDELTARAKQRTQQAAAAGRRTPNGV